MVSGFRSGYVNHLEHIEKVTCHTLRTAMGSDCVKTLSKTTCRISRLTRTFYNHFFELGNDFAYPINHRNFDLRSLG